MRISLLNGLKPKQIRMLLWWADKCESRQFKVRFPDRKYKAQYTPPELALRHGLKLDEIRKVIRGYKNKRIEKIVFDAIKPYLFKKNSINLKQQYQQRKNNNHIKPNDRLLTRISEPYKKKKERKTRAFSSGYNSAVECEYLQEFLNFTRIERNYSDTTITTYQGKLIRYLSFLNDRGKSIEDVKPSDVFELLESLTLMGLSPQSRGQQLSAIRMFHRFLIDEDYLSNSPAEGLGYPKIPKKVPRILNIEEIELILAQTDITTLIGIRDRAMIDFLYAAGVRVGELLTVRIGSLDLKKGIVRVFGKGRKERIVCIHDKAIDSIQLYLNESRPLLATKESSDVLFLNHRGKPLTRQGIGKVIKHYGRKAGIKKRIFPHLFRHSFATHMVMGGANERVVQELMGHADISSTQIYTHLDRKFLGDVLKKYHPMSKYNYQPRPGKSLP